LSGTVLVVDNEAFNVDLVKTILTRAGFKVISANSGKKAISMVKKRNPDLVLMDVQLPEMDGLETTRRLMGDPATRAVKVLAFSALAMPSDIDKALEAGCVGYITKPVGARELIEKVKAHIG